MHRSLFLPLSFTINQEGLQFYPFPNYFTAFPICVYQVITCVRFRLLLPVTGILLLFCFCRAGEVAACWSPTRGLAPNCYNKIHHKQKTFSWKRPQITTHGKHPGDIKCTFLRGNFSVITNFPENPAPGQDSTK